MAAARAGEAVAKTQAYPGGGNPDFKLTPEMETAAMDNFFAETEQQSAPPARQIETYGAEDMELDRKLEQMAKRAPVEESNIQVVVPEKKTRDVLRNYTENYKPASSIMELDDQCFQAQSHDIDSTEATEAVVKHFCKSSFSEVKKVGYFIYKNIRVYIDGHFEQNKDADKLTMEQRLHSGGMKIDIAPIITPQKV
jgi:hypothetical protein